MGIPVSERLQLVLGAMKDCSTYDRGASHRTNRSARRTPRDRWRNLLTGLGRTLAEMQHRTYRAAHESQASLGDLFCATQEIRRLVVMAVSCRSVALLVNVMYEPMAWLTGRVVAILCVTECGSHGQTQKYRHNDP